MLFLPVLHVFSMSFEIGYTVRGSVGGQMHEIDWVYRPWYIEKDERLAVIVSYPGYRPMHRDKTWSDLEVTIFKTSRQKPSFLAVFKTEALRCP